MGSSEEKQRFVFDMFSNSGAVLTPDKAKEMVETVCPTTDVDDPDAVARKLERLIGEDEDAPITYERFVAWAGDHLDLPFVMGMLSKDQPGPMVRLVTLMRLVRCLKVVQVMPTVLNVLTTRLAMTNSSTELFKFGILLILLVHYLACFWAFIGLNWEPSEDSSAAFEQSWIDAYGMQSYAMHRYATLSSPVTTISLSSRRPHISHD